MSEQGSIVNPSAVGNPDETPIVYAGAAMRAWLRPCTEQASGETCGGVNGYHAEGCPKDSDA